MAHLIIIQDATFRNYMEAFRSKFTRAPVEVFPVTILMGLLHQDGSNNMIWLIARSGRCGNHERPPVGF